METRSSEKPFGTGRLSVARLAAAAVCLLSTFLVSAAPLTIAVKGVLPNGSQEVVTTNYRWIVEEDATKLSIPGQRATPTNYSFSFHTSYMPVIAAGRVGTERSGVTADPDVARLYAQQPPVVCAAPGASAVTCLDPSKRYYVSVAADGYQMGGAPVVFGNGGATATVYVNKYDLPTAQVSVFAFNDNSPINGSPDLPAETGLEGFTVVLLEAGGTYGQSGGQVTQDAFGNPLGTTYFANGDIKAKGKGVILTGRDGTATIKNLFPAKYTVVITPPVGSDWHQTSTIEGTRGQDAWVKNNEPSFFQEYGPPGHHVFIGFTRSGCIQGTSAGRCVGLTGGTPHAITGTIVNVHNSRPPLYNFEKGAPVTECWVGLNETGGGTRGLYATACKKDGTFRIPNVPPGSYELVVWDEPLDMILGTQIITVGGADLALGNVPVFSWFARYQGRVFQDIDGTGLPFFNADFDRTYVEVNPTTGIETIKKGTFKVGDLKPPFGEGIANNIRFRDGSIYQSVTTKTDGTFAFTEFFPFFNWMIAEIDYARFKATGATMVTDAGGLIVTGAGTAAAPGNDTKLWKAEKGLFGGNDPALAYDPWIRLNPQLQPDGLYYRNENCSETGGQCAILLEGMQGFLGLTNHIEWGKQPYAFGENGGIAGIVHYAITRAEDDPRFAAAENWEPGIPHVQVNLFLDCDGDGKIDKPLNDGTGQCSPAGLSKGGYVADLPDVDNYPFCWSQPETCGLTAPTKGPEDVCRSAACRAAVIAGTPPPFGFGDVLQWGGANGAEVAIGIGTTDAWDDKIPTGCVKPPAGPVSNGGVTSGYIASLDCFDGLYNFNQIRPAVFDGGYAFGRVAGQAELPTLIGLSGKGTYIVEANAPPGYLHQGNGDKNVVFGDSLKASPAALPFECVGIELDVPATLTLFPGESNSNYDAGQRKWKKCDMKAVPIVSGTNPAPDFFMFTEAPVAGHGVGFILDDTASEFNRFAPTFGEKYAPPHLPISIQDWTGREISRVYSDEFGSYNFLVPSSFTINPPFPSGVMPSMMVSCMNHPGPVKVGVNADGSDKLGIDPFFNRKYTQFCYTLQYLPGKTTYLDTPVLPIAAFAPVEKFPLDCECQDKTPAIYSVNNAADSANSGNNGPWVRAGSIGTLTLVSSGAVHVPNPAYDPADSNSPRQILRDYGFGTGGTVRLGARDVTPAAWNNDILTITVPANMPIGEHQLVVTRADSGKETVVGLTVHVSTKPPRVVAPGASIQAVIEASSHGELITIPPGVYNEYLILDKRVRLQGWGADSVTINASKASAGGLAAWRALLNKKVDARCSLPNGNPGVPAVGECPAGTPLDVDTGAPTILAGPNRTFDPLPGQTLGIDQSNNEPLLFGPEEGPGILVVGKASNNGSNCDNTSDARRIDGLSISGSDAGGGILASGYNCGLRITNNRIVGNYGTYGGGIRVGHTALVDGDTYTDGVNRNVVIDHNWISQNGASETAVGTGGGGGVTLGSGSNGYTVSANYICGNFSMADGGGISHFGRSTGTNTIAANKILLNQTFNQAADPTAGGLFIGGQPPLGAGASDGSGDVNVNANLIQYNHAGSGAGGGVSISNTASADNVVLTNNMIVNNVAAYAGGGVVLANVSSNVRLVNNTIASNASTATNRQSFPAGQKVQSNAQVGGVARLGGSDPTLLNNIVWENKSYRWSITPADPNQPQVTTLTAVSGFSDFTPGLACGNCILSGAAVAFVKPLGLTPQTDPDQPVVLPETTVMQTALTFDEGGNFINVIFSPLTPFELAAPSVLRADYHIQVGSAAVDAGAAGTNNNRVPTTDFDGQARQLNNGRAINVDVGADERAPLPPTVSITAPVNGATVSGNVGLAATVTNGGSVVRVQFLVGGVVVSTDTSSAAWTGTWSTSFADNGAKVITAQACSNSTGTCAVLATSPAVNVTVNNAPVGAATFSPSPVGFGNVADNTTASRTVTVTNGGPGALTISNVALTNDSNGRFKIQSQNCVSAGAIAPNGTCSVVVTFNPGAFNTQRSGTLTITDNGTGAHSVPLSGN